jgi:probable rRNA maturation factor
MTELADVVIEDPRWEAAGLVALVERAARAALAHLGLPTEGYELAVLGCDDARIAVLNGDFRDKPAATNVLSWPSEERGAAAEGGAPGPPPPSDPDEPAHLGDLALAFDTCAAEADSAGKPLADHVTHLVVHGVLHLLGYDHTRDGDAALMERIETEILGKLGVPDPYREDAG